MIQNNQIQIVKQKMIEKQYKNPKRKWIQNSNDNLSKSNKMLEKQKSENEKIS